MNRDIIKGNWKELKGKIKQQWGELTDDDMIRLEGNADELEGILQQRYGYERNEAEKAVKNFISQQSPKEKIH